MSAQQAVEVLAATRLQLVETEAPALSAEHEDAMDRVWEQATRANPSLFDGPTAVCTALARQGQAVELTWARTTYRRFALRRVPGAPVVSSVFVTVAQPVEDGRLVIGRMSESTAAPGRWQLPGGNVEPPQQPAQALDEAELRRQGAKELAEEVGVHTDPDDLTLLALTRGENGNIGVHYLAPVLPERTVRAQFAGLVDSEISQGRTPELDQITPVESAKALELVDGQHVDYLAPLLDRYTAGRSDE
ncbi:NUDIX hydrolase [Kitasatospora aureofaciens]|uniref:NUDIX hydrolase n=1 Tax=Kitasatospora aureofaciens TaxID=1894 RepID=A0A1E7NET2_KITAU|nr:NUDIX hydrolase [Kitasatospora aureofaciens]OEV39145.1 NUDIX hydrolase [Kitasatospora aureofaciens]